VLLVVLISQPLAALPSQSPKGGVHTKPQVPLAQVDVAFARAAHAAPHAPQCPVLTDVSISQPLTAAPSQSRNVPVHVNPHVPAAHVDVALARVGHAVPHAPQCAAVLVVFVSQPVVALPSQSPQPTEHVNPHVPAVHPIVALLRAGHTLPHAPQFDVLARRSLSHPSAALALQSENPALHVNPHVPAAQMELAFARAGHALPHAVQLAASVLKFDSQPSRSLPLQFPNPPSHVIVQSAERQMGDEFARVGHRLLHVPQCVRSESVSTQTIPPPTVQIVLGRLHITVHREAAQNCPAGHALPHAPQFAALVDVSTHAPPQNDCPLGQRHAPMTQLCPPEHALPHAPQCTLLTPVSTHEPAQSIRPMGHWHAPMTHICPATHALPHAPQCAASVFVSTHVPLHNVCPIGQTQAPATQDCPGTHALPHTPQCATSDAVSMHAIIPRTVQILRGALHVMPQRPSAQNSPDGHATPQPPQFIESDVVSVQRPAHAISPVRHAQVPAVHT